MERFAQQIHLLRSRLDALTQSAGQSPSSLKAFGRMRVALEALEAEAEELIQQNPPVTFRRSRRDLANKKGTDSIGQSEELYRIIVENAQDYAIFTLDMEGKITTWNAGAERLFGYSKADAIGMSVVQIFTPEDRQRHALEQEIQTTLQLGRAVNESWRVRQDGSRFWASGFMHILRDEQGTVQGFVKIVRDFTERRAYENQIEELNERLRRAMRETHHRVKNNLQVIAAMVEMQVIQHPDAIPTGKVKQFGSQIRAMAVVHELLTKGTTNSGDTASLSIQDMLETLIPLLQHKVGECQLILHAQQAEIDSRRGTSLAIIINELVSNAIKHAGGNVTVSFALDNKIAVLEVTDDGPGFPDGFDPTTYRHVGLELIEHLSKWDLSGNVEFLNRPGGGGQVIVTFPLE